MSSTKHWFIGPVARLALVALVLSACASPAAVPTEPETSTAPPPTVTAAPPTVTARPPTATVAPEMARTSGPGAGVPATSFFLIKPLGLAFDADGKLYVSVCAEGADIQIFQIDQSGQLTVYAGLSQGFSGDGGPASEASFGCLGKLAFDRAGALIMADIGNNRIRRIDQKGIVSTVAGNGPTRGDPGDFGGDGGPATLAQLWYPVDVAPDSAGNLYIADSGNNRIRKVDPQGVITTVAGNGTAGFAGDGGPATAAQLNIQLAPDASSSEAIALDAAGNLYIADGGNARVRKVDSKGIITTIAGTGEPGYSGDGGPATAAQLSRPAGLAFDAAGALYIADSPSLTFSNGNRIRKIDKAGTISTVAGSGEGGFSGDGGPATSAHLLQPLSIAFDTQGNLYIVDTGNNRIRKVDQNGIITTVAGTVI
jgi:sugar lactone lactonase YvrE